MKLGIKKMKKIIFLIVLLFSGIITAQTPNWTGIKETNINVGSAVSVDIFTNRDGNHIIVQESNSLKYYKMNLNGQAGSPITLESTSVISPSITGDGTRLYVVYRKSSETFIRTRVSTNGGSSWSYLAQNPPNSNGSNIESVLSNNNLHITFQEGNSVYYSRKYILDGSAWTSRYTVSGSENGTLPRIAASYGGAGKDSVYFVWQKAGTFQLNHRRYEVTTNSWSSVLFGHIVSDPYVNITSVWLSGFRVTSSTLIMYFTYAGTDLQGNYRSYFNWVWKDKNNNTFQGSGYPYLAMGGPVYSTTTFDGNSHTAYYYFQLAGGEGGGQSEVFTIRRSKQPSGYPDDIIYDYGTNPPNPDPMHINLSSAGNEVHAIWKDNLGGNNGNNLRYRWDNQNPIAPQNLTMTSYNNHPKLVWQKNPEQDVDYYRIYRKIGSLPYTLHTTVSASLPTEYVDNEETVCNPSPGVYCQSGTVAKYYITAVDLTSKVSSPSNEVEAIVQGEDPYKIFVNNPTEVVDNYELSQNYPNPFNPTTTILYKIKEAGFVTLKVYDVLGNEVASLVNETKVKGSYSVTFDASNLPSGIYIYSLRVKDFVQIRKMTLLR